MQEIELDIEFTKPIDYITFQIGQQCRGLSQNELKMLALVHLRGVNDQVKDTIVKLSIFKSRQSIENHLTKFRKLGIIKNNQVVLKKPISVDKSTCLRINMKMK